MEKDDEIRDLMAKLMQAVEASLSTSSEVREALAELVRNGYEARLFFVANAESTDATDHGEGEEGSDAGGEDSAGEEEETYVVREIGAAPDGSDVHFELTKLDRDFLKSVHIRPENG